MLISKNKFNLLSVRFIYNKSYSPFTDVSNLYIYTAQKGLSDKLDHTHI